MWSKAPRVPQVDTAQETCRHTQVLNLKNNELDKVADFLGHDIHVHRDFYRLPVPTTQLAKLSKLVLSMEKGNLSSMQRKSLDEMEVEGL